MKSTLNTIFISLLLINSISYSQIDSVLISEVMFYPAVSNSEFIEIYNLSEQNSIDISRYQIIYSTSNADTIISNVGSTIIPPKSFAVVFEGDYDATNGIYSELVPPNAVVLSIDNNAFGSSGMANTSDRVIYLVNPSGDTVNVYEYSANNGSGISDEKIDLSNESNSSNWANSIGINGTPGSENSVSTKEYDLAVSELSFSPTEIFENEEVQFTVKIKNIGLSTASDFSAEIFVDFNSDSLAQNEEIIIEENIQNLSPLDSLEVVGITSSLPRGEYNVYAIVNFLQDQKLENNLISNQLAVFPKKNNYNDIIISEIMYAPTEDEPEWLEIYNLSESAINLNDWRIEDRSSSIRIADSSFFIQPGEFIVLSDDESISNYYDITSPIKTLNLPSLNNSNDDLKILDSLKRTIDSISYSKDWGGDEGYSLEKIDLSFVSNDSTNWGSSVSPFGGTPGKENSLTPKLHDLVLTQFNLSEEYAVISNPVNLNLQIKNMGTANSNIFKVQIFSDSNYDSTGQQNEIIFESNQSGLAIGDSITISFESTEFKIGENYYIAEVNYIEDMDFNNNISFLEFIGVELNEQRNDIIINEIMYAPNKPEPEWVELYNRSDKTLNLKNYQIADEVDTVLVIENDLLLNPLDYFVIAKDTAFIDVYNDTLSFIISSFPNLNNSGDCIILLDSLNRVIDSLRFNPDWGGSNGLSLERFNSEYSSIDSTNWRNASIDSGGTPGMLNSISQREFDLEIVNLIFTPRFPTYGDQVNISAKIRNIGKTNITAALSLFEDENLDTTNFLFIETKEISSLSSGDSTVVDFSYVIDSIKDEYAFLIEILSAEDEVSTNNKLYETIAPGYSYNVVVINEIMYSPINGEPEWVELYNSSNDKINLKEWSITDILTTPKTNIITDNDLLLDPNDLVVISKDSTIWDYHNSISSKLLVQNFANMNNDVDGVVLKDQYGNFIDSVKYHSDWGGTSGFSLERRFHYLESNDSTNWNSSIDIELSTPGRKNSITPKDYDLMISEIKTIPEFPSFNEEVLVEAKIKNVGVNDINNFSVKFNLIKAANFTELSLINNLSLQDGDSIIVQSDNSFLLQDSVIIDVSVLAEVDNDTANNNSFLKLYPGFLKNSVLINEFIANSDVNEAEWIELYNNSNSDINIKGWSISDYIVSPTIKKITEENIEIAPNEFLIITSDTSKFGKLDNTIILEVKFGTLGNREDGILLYDFNHKVIDSLRYDQDWRIEKGRSLERVSIEEPTIDIFNWLPSLSVSGSTPGASNSIAETKPYTKGDISINEIMFDPDVDNSEFIELYNSSESTIDIGGWNLIDGSGNYFEISETFLELPSNQFFVFYSDSSIYYTYPELVDHPYVKMSNDGNLSLSNEEEILVIIDHWGNTIDSVKYSSDWHNQNILVTKNRTIERINPHISGNDFSNWSTSVDQSGATPGMENSIFIGGELSEAQLAFSPNPFSPDNDGFEDFSIISYNLSANTAQIRVKIFDDKGRLVRTLVNNKASSAQGSAIFDGLDDSGNPLKIGMYIVFLEASNSSFGVVDVLKDVIVVARKL